MPIGTIVALKPSMGQSALSAEQRLAGTLLGAIVAAIFLFTINSKLVLEVVIVVILAFGDAIRGVNYALYTTAIAAAVLIAIDLPHPSNLSDEGQRVLYTFIGVGIAVVITLGANLLQKRVAHATPTAGGTGDAPATG